MGRSDNRNHFRQSLSNLIIHPPHNYASGRLMSKKPDLLPSWYGGRDYDFINSIDEEGWILALLDRMRYIPPSELFRSFANRDSHLWLSFRDKYPSIKSFFEAYLEETNGTPPLFDQRAISGSPTETINSGLKSITRDEISILIRCLKKKCITSRRMKTWRNQKILPLFDLLMWRNIEHFGQGWPHNWNIGEWLFYEKLAETGQPLDRYNYSLEELMKAITLIDEFKQSLRNTK